MANRVPDVSVIVAVYNGMPYLELTLDSLVRQTIGLDRIQVLIVDDGSTDETPAFADRMAAGHPSFEVIHQPNSGGPAGPRNLALERVRGRYVFFLDADDYLSDDALQAMVETADANGTDVVLARIKGVGGRNAPRSMFTRTVPHADVFSSPVYWTLNPMKLFRTEMVRSLGLAFPVDFPWGEDQPFVAAAYIKGNGISIVADKDYVFWAYREDLSNISTSAVTLADRMPVAGHMFDYVAANVGPGPDRDRLMLRHFQVELLSSAAQGYRVERDAAARTAAFERFREIARDHYNERIEGLLKPQWRVLMKLIAQGREVEFAAYLEELAHLAPPPVVVEGDRVYLAIPWFRDPAKALPDELFDIGAGTRVECRLQPLTVDSEGVHIVAACRFGALTDRVTDVSLVVRPRSGGPEVVVPVGHEIVADGASPAIVAVDDVVPGSRLLPTVRTGTNDVFMRIAAGEVRRERRLVECAAPAPGFRILVSASGEGAAKSGLVVTTAKGNLSLRVLDGVAADVRLVDNATGPTIELTRSMSEGLSAAAPRLGLSRSGKPVELPMMREGEGRGSDVFTFDARGLSSGEYSVRVGLAASSGEYPLVAVNAAHRIKRTTGRGGFVSIDGSGLTVVSEWRFQARRVLGRLRRARRNVVKRAPGR